MGSDEGAFKAALRAFAVTFPPLKLALYLNDAICYLFGKLVDAIRFSVIQALKLVWYLFGLTFKLVQVAWSWLGRQLMRFEVVRNFTKYRPYEQLTLADLGGPIPYANSLIKRLFTYHGGLLLALGLYVFVYFVLVHHHTYVTVSVSLVLLLVYLVLIENSHTFRSVLMLCLPIMFTNRGRALVYCSMLAIMAAGPIKTLKHNVKEIHSSLTCCKQYLIVSGDKSVDENYVQKLVKVEEVVMELVESIKEYARDLKKEFAEIIELAVACEQFIIDAVDLLKNIVSVCNVHSEDVYRNCAAKMIEIRQQCRLLFDPFRFSLCDLSGDLGSICTPSKLPSKLCQLPIEVIDYIERTIGAELKQYIRIVENEFYVNIDIDRKYSYNLTQSKSYSQVAREIKFDVEQKFWYIHLIGRVFNFITLALVLFILATAAVYHMHYITDVSYDNMYLDQSLLEIDSLRQVRANLRKERKLVAPKRGEVAAGSANNLITFEEDPDELPYGISNETDDSDEENQENLLNDNQGSLIDSYDVFSNESDSGNTTQNEEQRRQQTEADVGASPTQGAVQNLGLVANQELGLDRRPAVEPKPKMEEVVESASDDETPQLFPLTRRHERRYLKPTSFTMNHAERSKLKWSSLVWLIIIGYIWFFVILDFAFYSLVLFLVEILREILFTSELPLVDLETKSKLGANLTVVKYNRTYLNSLRRQQMDKLKTIQLNNSSIVAAKNMTSHEGHHNSSIQAFYRRLMDSIERDIPDDVMILDSLEECLPKAHVPRYDSYRTLLYLAMLTFVAVIIEAYALRTRHCIANLYYPERARKRSVWLYNKMLAERAKFGEDSSDKKARELEPVQEKKWTQIAANLLADRIKR